MDSSAKVLVVHNAYGRYSGEEAVVETQCRVLAARGHQVERFSRSSEEIPHLLLGPWRAFFSGIYSFASARAMRRRLTQWRPDVVHVHNVFPLISASILPVCRRAGVPVVMTLHNYRLVCPTGLHLWRGEVCEKCLGGREYWCVLRNCERSLAKSVGYAARTYFARRQRLFLDNVDVFIALTDFQRQRLVSEGYPDERFVVIPNMVVAPVNPQTECVGDYVGYAGRISPEKGIPQLLEAARRISEIPFQAAGAIDRSPELLSQSPQNFQFRGHLVGGQLNEFFRSSRIVAFASRCFEGFPVTLVEAMGYAKPVVAPRIGSFPEIVQEGVTGLLFEPGNAEQLADRIRYLWERPDLCRTMGQAAHEKALREYSEDRYYSRLMDAYNKAMAAERGVQYACPLGAASEVSQ